MRKAGGMVQSPIFAHHESGRIPLVCIRLWIAITVLGSAIHIAGASAMITS